MKKLYLFLALSSLAACLFAQPELVWDINQAIDSSFSSSPQYGVEGDGELYFVAQDFTYGKQVWVTDGDTAHRITNLTGDPNNWGPHTLIPFRSHLYFIFNDGIHGAELWRTDGTEEGTELFIDIDPVYNETWVPRFYILGDTMYFIADDGIHGDEIWYTDGTVAGTKMLKDLLGGVSNPMQLYGVFKFHNKTFLVTNYGFYSTIGTEESTEKAINTWYTVSNVYFAVFNDSIYFGGELQSNPVGNELYKSDGTIEGTQLVADLNTGAPHSYPREFTLVNDTLYFIAYTDTGNVNLYLTDGSAAGTKPVKIIKPGTVSADLQIGGNLNGKLYFTAFDDDHGKELWISDGTKEGTKVIKDIIVGTGGSFPHDFVVIGNKVFFKAYGSTTGYELWVTDGTEGGTDLVKEFYPGSLSGVSDIFSLGSQLILSASTPESGSELWFGNPANDDFTLFDIASGSFGSNPQIRGDINGKLLIEATSADYGTELWIYDTLTATTTLLKDIRTGTDGSFPMFFSKGRDYFYFRAHDENSNLQLWRTDGTTAGTKKITSFTSGFGVVSKVVGMGDYDYCMMNNGDGTELYKTQGEPGDPVMVKDIYAGTTKGAYGEIAVLDSLLFFAADDGTTTGYALWRSNGTEAGTYLLKDLYLGGDVNVAPLYLMATSNRLYFMIYDGGVYGYELYISDGTTGGTHLFKDIEPGTVSSYPTPQIASDTLLFFTATTSEYGKEIWMTDGDSVRFLGDIFPGTGNSNPSRFKLLDGTIYFMATKGFQEDAIYKFEDDTIVEVMADLDYNIDPIDYALVNGHLLFSNEVATNHHEIWQVNESACGIAKLNDMYPFLNSQDTFGNNDSKYLYQLGNTLYYQSKNSAAGTELFRYTPEVVEVFAITMLDTSFCSGGEARVTYDFTCTFETSNAFIVELSDVTGSFAAASTIDTFKLKHASSGDLEFNMPVDLVGSERYRIRVKSILPELISEDNGYDLTIGKGMTYYDTIYVCYGDSILLDGKYVKTSGERTGNYSGVLGCDSIRKTMVYLEALPVVTLEETGFMPDTLDVCDGEDLEFQIYNWVELDSFKIETFRLSAENEALSFTFDSSDPELVVFAEGYTGIAACKRTDKMVLRDRTITNLLIGVPEIDGFYVSVTAANMPEMVYTWIWTWGDGGSTYASDTATHYYSIDGTYSISLIGQSICDTDTSSVNVDIATLVPGLEQTGINVYPNPATDRFVIENGDFESRILIYNVSGVEVLTLELKANERYEVNEKLEPGVYFVRAETSTGDTGQMKLIIQ